MMTASLHAGARSGHSKQQRLDRGTFNKILMCAYCKGTHTAIHCVVVVNTEKRFEYVKREGLCFNCLGKHRVSQCTSQSCCKKCNNKYHTSICGVKSLLPPMKKDNPAQSTETNSQQPMQKDLKAQSTVADKKSSRSVSIEYCR